MTSIEKTTENFAKDWLRGLTLYKGSAKAVGLTDNFITVLYALYKNPANCTQKYLVNNTYLPKQTIHFVVAKLQKQGMVTMSTSANDRRVKVIVPTAKGKDFLRKSIVPFVKDTEAAFAKMAPADRRLLLKLFERYIDNLQGEVAKSIAEK